MAETQPDGGKELRRVDAYGPWIVTKDEIPDPHALHLTTRLNGKTMQNTTTDLLIWKISYLISYCSKIIGLKVGDAIATGTPGGVGSKRTPPIFMKPGDLIEVEVSGIGVLRNTVALARDYTMRCPRSEPPDWDFSSSYVVTGLAWVMYSSSPLAQTAWPTRPITIVVPSPAGSASDIVARTITPSMARKLGQPVIIDNRTGAEGTIAGRAVARSEPNGYTIGLGTPSSYAIAPSLRANLGYDPLKDFAPVSLLGNTPYLLVVNSGLGVNSVAELTALARSKPGVLNYSSAGEGSIAHLGMLMLAKKLGITLTHVPYKSTAQSIIDVANGTIHLQLATIAPTISLYQAGRVRILGVADTQRVALLPEIPTPSGARLIRISQSPFGWRWSLRLRRLSLSCCV